MSLKRYLDEIGSVASEIGLYTPLATHVFGALLGYPANHRVINKSGAHGIPDIRLYSQEDDSEWAVVEVKFEDSEIRDRVKRERIWNEQILGHGYISPDTFYVVLCAPRTFLVCDLEGQILEALQIEEGHLLDPRTGAEFPLTDTSFRERLFAVSYAASLERRQFEAFRAGELKSGHIPITLETLPHLQSVFEGAIGKLKEYCRFYFRELQAECQGTRQEIAQIDQRLEDIGSGAIKLRQKLLYKKRTLRARHRLALQLFEYENDYERFKHDQTYAGTQGEEHFEDIFCTNTAYVALSRLFFVRICEDVGLTTRKISNSGIAVWRNFVENIKGHYQDLLDVAFKDVAHVYVSLFEPTVFDWFGKGNTQLHDILERILFRLNAFNFREINRDVLGSMYQYFRPHIERRRLGEYYTPDEVVDFILSQTGMADDRNIMQKRILDPACGSFTFGVRAMEHLLRAGASLSPENKIELVRRCLRGQDINPFSTFLSHLSVLFSLIPAYLEAKGKDPKFEMAPFDVKNRNSLTYGIPAPGERSVGQPSDEFDEQVEKVDYVIGNPPFVRNERIPVDDRAVLEALYASLRAGNTDLAAYFLYASLEYWLKTDGELGMVAPLSLANAAMTRELRRYLNGFQIRAVVSLEWIRLRKEIFQGIDIIPMLVFVRKATPDSSHTVRTISGLEHRADLERFVADRTYAADHSSEIDFRRWYSLSPTGDWPVEATSRDVAVLEKLNRAERLSAAAKACYGIKLGAAAEATSPHDGSKITEERIPLVKGQNICFYYVDRETPELFHLDKLNTVSDASIWGNLEFYRRNAGKYDEDGTGRSDLKHEGFPSMNGPSDVRCCCFPEVYRTLAGGWLSPLECAVHNSASILIPTKFSAPATTAIVNSLFSRFYAFLLLRSGVVQRGHSHFYPRTLESLPLPRLRPQQSRELHRLAAEASVLSDQGRKTLSDLYCESVAQAASLLTKAGFLGVQARGLELIDREDLAAVQPQGNKVVVDGGEIWCDSADTLLLTRTALLASDKDEFTVHDVENAPLPSDSNVRGILAQKIRDFAADQERIQSRVLRILEEIDEIVSEGLGLTAAEHEVIRRRCQEFPLSVTVERPRFAWSADRKRQARRTYQPGERFK